MSRITQVLRYFITTYPYPEDLFQSTVQRLVYLADWEAARTLGAPITRVRWILDRYGPTSAAVWSAMDHDRMLSIVSPSHTIHTVPVVRWQGPSDYRPRLAPPHRTILDAVIQHTKDLTYSGLVALVYRTDPAATSLQGTVLPLRRLAHDLKSG